MNTVLVMLGALGGAPARYLLDRAVQRRHPGLFPLGTLTVNLLACFLLGLLTGLAVSRPGTELYLVCGIGFCGAFSTFSTFSAETVGLARRAPRLAVANAVLSTVCGVGAAYLGVAAASLAH